MKVFITVIFDIFMLKIEFKIKFKKHKEAQELIERYLQAHNTSKELWLLCVKSRLDESTSQNEADVHEIVKKALATLKEKDTLDLWRSALAWFETNNCKSTEKLFQVLQTTEIFLSLLSAITYSRAIQLTEN